MRWPELNPTGWPDEVKIDFLRSQFSLQRHHYLTYYSEAEFAIIERGSTPAGRLGIGTALLGAVIRGAENERKSVSIHVEKFNPAQRLYRRLGFLEAGESGPYWLMVRPAPLTDHTMMKEDSSR